MDYLFIYTDRLQEAGKFNGNIIRYGTLQVIHDLKTGIALFQNQLGWMLVIQSTGQQTSINPCQS
jgi:hypothetical protein